VTKDLVVGGGDGLERSSILMKAGISPMLSARSTFFFIFGLPNKEDEKLQPLVYINYLRYL
jgi:hypothetical protein